ncbi:hypothetical protein ASE00_07610 [Sphingomonas sp. Root710]|uniref:beta strand repeat-containing protein n=1 Tax=Sphingomonas sp. Root710 TaxID=1736594 RepID=UPI0006FCF383|nr:calcium-binding protein [Sphingomonas sp. Root710]KRB86550.1 hypothetical protein ASE00_07610 [Sphingomonas sp. Root710]
MATITGTSGNDYLTGTSGADTISGLDGNDRMIGGAGADAYDGGNGFDWASYETAGSALVIDLYDGSRSTGEAVGDTYTGVESYVGTAYNDVFWAGSTTTTFDGGPGGDDDVVNYSLSAAGITLTFNLTTTTQTGSGVGGLAQGDGFWAIDRVIGTSYNDVYNLNGNVSTVTITEASGGGTDTIQTNLNSYSLGANIENLTFTGTGNFSGEGNGGNNVLTGGAGNDLLRGQSGADQLIGGGGTDTASYQNAVAGVTVDLKTGANSTGDAAGDTFSSIEWFRGSLYADTFIASSAAEGFDGNSTGDTVDYSGSGAAVNVNLVSGMGSGGDATGDSYVNIERVKGSAYDDVYTITSAHVVVEAPGGGIDEVRTSASSLSILTFANVEKLTYTGTGNFTGEGNSGNNTITGGSGNDTLKGASGADYLVGGLGTDTASYDNAIAGVTVDLKTGMNSTGDAAGDTFSGIEWFRGSSYNDTFIASAATEGFDGNGGISDIVDYSGSSSAVTVNLVSGSGSGGDAAGDTYANVDGVKGSANDDIFVLTSGQFAIESTGGGVDEVQTASSTFDIINFTNVEKLTFIGSGNFVATGNSGANTITGKAGNDTLSGAEGNDTLIGGASGDQLNGGSGTDTASYETSVSAISLNMKTGTHTGDAAGDIFNSIEAFKGSNSNDTFVSGTASDSFDGNGGTDTVDYSTSAAAVAVNLTGGTGSSGDAAGDTYTSIEKVIGSAYADTLSSAMSGDTLAGGTGSDIYVVGASGITVTEASGEGTDEIQTSLASFSIAGIANVENLSYTGSGNFVGTGSAGNNVITGGVGNDTLIGGAGADQLIGGSGTDAADYSASGSAVTINLTAATSSGGDAAGDSFSSIEKAIGSNYADSLSSATSGHTLAGGAGNDIYEVGSSGVTVVEASGEGTDEVQTGLSSLSIASFANVENLTYTGSSSFTGTGNAGNNILTGGNGNDTLIGGGGADQLIGGSGTDVASYENASSGVTLNFKTGTHTGDAAGDSFTSIDAFKGSNFADTFVSGASADTFNGNGGTDTVDYSTSASAITVNLTAGTGSGGDAAGDSYTSIEKVIGSAYADNLSSSTSGHILAGGTGDDLYFVGSSGVTVTEAPGEGSDEIQTGLSSFSIASFANVENLTYTGSSNFMGTGNTGDNIVTGGIGDDTLVGGAGSDQLIGGFGTDTADYSASASAVTVDLTTGTSSGGDAAGDSFASIERVIGSSYADNLSSSTSGHNLYGGDGDDTVAIGDGTALGDGGNDTISSDGTIAVLYGGAGDDTFSVIGSASIFGGEDSDTYDLSSALLDTVTVRDDGSTGFDKVFLPFLDSTSFTQTQVGNDLVLADGTYSVSLKDWFAGFNTIEEFETLDHNTFTI